MQENTGKEPAGQARDRKGDPASTPLRTALLAWLDALGEGRADRRDAARWAIEAVLAYDPERDEPEHPYVWELVERVGCADLEVLRGAWLHSEADFSAWAESLEARERGAR